MKYFRELTKFEKALWITSICVIIGSFLISGRQNPLTVIASLIGVTALIFVAKGYVIGQVLTVVFAVFYGIISFYFKYYGEMITYLGMTAPIAALSAISWFQNPYKDTNEVKVHKVTRRQWIVLAILSVLVTAVFYFILNALGTSNMLFSTISVTTSFIASYLTYYRSPYYAIGYSANDIVLIILWILASLKNISYLPMIFCFIMFFLNDMYGFFNWQRMRAKQKNCC